MMTHVANNFSTFLSLSFAGNRWARSENDKDIVIITDVNGFIAGEQSVVMRKYSNIYFDFDSSPFYVLDDFFGEEAYLATAYFVDPEIICNGGRTDEEFALQGTGDRLFFQNGPTASDLEEIPLTQAEMDAGVSISYMLQRFMFSFILTQLITG
jgi:hypothetical protein